MKIINAFAIILFVILLVCVVERMMYVKYDYIPDVVHAYNECGRKPFTLYSHNTDTCRKTMSLINEGLNRDNNVEDVLSNIKTVHMITNSVYLVTGPFTVVTNKEEQKIAVVSEALIRCDKCNKVIKVIHTEYERPM